MRKTIVVIFGFVSSAALAQTTLLDPRTRDEDISATVVNVNITRASDGLYVYNYSYSSSTSNKGIITDFLVDISCPAVADRTGLPDQPNVPGLLASVSDDNKHAPVNVFAVYGTTTSSRIIYNNRVSWGAHLLPGGSVSGISLVSTMSPKSRQYTLVPAMDNDYPWNYQEGDESDPTVPWIPDFTVYGTTQGPSCASDPPPPPPPPSAIFPGTVKPEESPAVNALLAYSTPLSDRFHVAPGTQQLAFTIHYGKDVDPKTFRVEPQSDKIRNLFNPKKDFAETVFVPLESGKNKFTLSVQREFAPPGQAKPAGDPPRGRLGPEKDIDVFEVRVDVPSPPAPPPKGGPKK